MSARDDQQATRDAKALRARGYEPLLTSAGDAPGGGILSEGGPFFTVHMVSSLLDIYKRTDLVLRAKTRITAGTPDDVLWVPRWVAVLAWLRAYDGRELRTVWDAERSEEVRARNEERLVELREAALAALTLSGPEAARRLLEDCRG